MEGGGKWEDLNPDCLVNVFGRVGIQSLLLDVPFVCKSWYKVTLNPKCWERLVFPYIDPFHWSHDTFKSRLMDEYQVGDCFSVTALIKSVVKRSARSAALVALPCCTTEEALTYVGNECPALKVVLLPCGLPSDLELKFSRLVNKWTHLELLRLGSSFNMQEILSQVSIHCKNFVGLLVKRAHIGNDEASAIVTSVPNIKYLFLRYAFLEGENLVTILKGCKELVKLDVRDCNGFEGDDEIIKLASNIREFLYEGSRIRDKLADFYLQEDIRYAYREDGFHDGKYSDWDLVN